MNKWIELNSSYEVDGFDTVDAVDAVDVVDVVNIVDVVDVVDVLWYGMRRRVWKWRGGR